MDLPPIPESLRNLGAEGYLDDFISEVQAYGELCAKTALATERERSAKVASFFAQQKQSRHEPD